MMADSMLVRLFCGIYRLLLYAYPAAFRRRYGGEMQQVFRDRCRQVAQGVPGLLRLASHTAADWLVTVIRERTASMHPVAQLSGVASQTSDGVPVFYIGGGDTPRPGALVHGAILSLAIFSALTFTMMHWGNHSLTFLIGTYHSRPALLSVDRSSVKPTDLTTEVKVQSGPDDPWRRFASSYFKIILVLRVLDADQDFIISPSEIAQAPQRLWLLDLNHDGKLDPEECGLRFGNGDVKLDPKFVRQAGLDFMRFHPVLAALDADHDGEISASEIANSPAALKRLDKNRDGSLTADELAPPRMAR